MTEPHTDQAPVAFEKHLIDQVSDVAHPGVQSAMTDATVDAGLELQARSQWSYARRRFLRHRLAMTGLVMLIFIFGAGLLANWAAPYGFEGFDRVGGQPEGAAGGHHYLGRDELGRDFLWRTIYGIRTSMEGGVFGGGVLTILGTSVGASTGYCGGWVDILRM